MSRCVLVTGVSGFLGGHLALQLLNKGYRVRGSVRRLARGAAVRQAMQEAGADTARLEFVELDLLEDQGWLRAADGCAALVHVASPFVLDMPGDRNELIRPAVDGTRRALDAALAAGVRRIVLTSSMAAIDHGHRDYTRVFTERDWSDLSGPQINAYVESKTRAEREAWAIMAADGQRDRLAVINPAALLGPLLDDDPGTSASLVVRLLGGGMPAVPRLILQYVDVRDIAAVHVAAMEAPAAGARLVVSEEALSLLQMAKLLREQFPRFAGQLPRREMPDWFVKIYALFDASLRDNAALIGKRKRSDASAAVKLLGRSLIPARQALLATARSVIDRQLV